MVKRDEYLQSLKQWKDEQVIKVVTRGKFLLGKTAR